MNENRTSSSRTHRDGREPSGFCSMKQKTQSLPHCRGVIGSKSMPQDSLSSFSTSTRHSSPPALTTSIVSSSSPDVRNLKSSASRTRRPLIVQTRSPISSSSSAASESGSTPMIFIPFAIRSTSQERKATRFSSNLRKNSSSSASLSSTSSSFHCRNSSASLSAFARTESVIYSPKTSSAYCSGGRPRRSASCFNLNSSSGANVNVIVIVHLQSYFL